MCIRYAESRHKTHTPIFGEYALESADSELESADSKADSNPNSSTICAWVWAIYNRRPTLHNCRPTLRRVGLLSLSNMFNICPPTESPD